MSELGQAIATDTLRLERLLPGPIERVWAYLTDAEKRSQWFAGGDLEPRAGGKIQLVFDHDKISDEKYPEQHTNKKGPIAEGKVLRYDPPHALAYTFAGNSEVTFELSPKGPDVLLVITHRKIASGESFRKFSTGWHAHVDVLEDILRERQRRKFWTNVARLESEYTRLLAKRQA